MFIDLVKQPLDVFWIICTPESLQKRRTVVEDNALNGIFICSVSEFRFFCHNQQIVNYLRT